MKDRAQFHMNYWMIAILVFLGLQYLLSIQQEVATIPYSEFEQHLKEGRVEELAITERRIEGLLKASTPREAQKAAPLPSEPTPRMPVSEPPARPQIVRSGETSLEGLVRELLRPAVLTIGSAFLASMQIEQVVLPPLQGLRDQTGDSASLDGMRRSGRFAVRQAPVLSANLQAALQGRPLRQYRPQWQSLALLATGDGGALLGWHDWSAGGQLYGHCKDWLDRRFVKRHRMVG